MKSLSRIVLEDVLQKESLVVVDAARFKELEDAERILSIYKKHQYWKPDIRKCVHIGCDAFHVANSTLTGPETTRYENCSRMFYCMACRSTCCDKHMNLYMKRLTKEYDHTTVCFCCLKQNGRIE